MSEELKTLKDIERIKGNDRFVSVGILRTEAIKRAKHWDLRWKQLEELDGEDSYNAGYFKGMRDEVMLANDLTKEDLKDE